MFKNNFSLFKKFETFDTQLNKVKFDLIIIKKKIDIFNYIN